MINYRSKVTHKDVYFCFLFSCSLLTIITRFAYTKIVGNNLNINRTSVTNDFCISYDFNFINGLQDKKNLILIRTSKTKNTFVFDLISKDLSLFLKRLISSFVNKFSLCLRFTSVNGGGWIISIFSLKIKKK
jgi:hypothetical protein